MRSQSAHIGRFRNLIILLWSALLTAQSGNITSYAATTDQSKLISLVPPQSSPRPNSIEGVAIYASSFGNDEIRRLRKDGVLIGSDSTNNHIELIKGNILISPEKDIIINTTNARIQVAAGSTVFIVKNAESLTIYDLQQIKPKQISIIYNTNKFNIEPGQLLLLTKNSNIDLPTVHTNCRTVASISAKSTLSSPVLMNIFIADFSIISAFITIVPLQRLIASTNDQDQKFLGTLVKDAMIRGDNSAALLEITYK